MGVSNRPPGNGDGTVGSAATLDGTAIEILFDNRAGVALEVAAGTTDWSRSLNFPLTRAVTEDDDGTDLRSRFEITQGLARKVFEYMIDAQAFRELGEVNLDAGVAEPLHGYIVLPGADGRPVGTIAALFARVNIAVRGRHVNGHDILRFLLSLDNNVKSAATNITGVVALVPRVDALSVRGRAGI